MTSVLRETLIESRKSLDDTAASTSSILPVAGVMTTETTP